MIGLPARFLVKAGLRGLYLEKGIDTKQIIDKLPPDLDREIMLWLVDNDKDFFKRYFRKFNESLRVYISKSKTFLVRSSERVLFESNDINDIVSFIERLIMNFK
ncbi:MAG: hypothetical protein N3B21_18195 [Clostridia bacterium]|nr:hypothetical protein [Clostridia bacterium]